MKDLGFRESTRSGLSFATDDLKTPASKDAILAEAEKEVGKAASTTTAASSPSRNGTTRSSTPGPTPASRSPRR